MTMHLNSPLFDKVRVPSRIGAKAMGEAMCSTAGLDPEQVRHQAYHGRKSNPDIEAIRIRIAARMVAHNIHIADITSWFDGFSAETIYRWAREAKKREEA